MSSMFGQLFRVSTFGESHGGAVGVVVDGCPPMLAISEKEVQKELNRRKPGQSRITTARNEADQVQILSGVFQGKTLGTPILMLVGNTDARSQDYKQMQDLFRPSHADFTYQMKYGIRNWQGGGRSSARETIGRVAAGAIAKKLLKERYKTEILAYVKQVHDLYAEVDSNKVQLKDIEKNIVRCPDAKVAKEMIALIDQVRKQGDSLGGVVEAVARNVPIGWGEPVFDKLEADLAKAMMSLPASKGFEIGSGFSSIMMTGSEHNDPFTLKGNKVKTKSNFSGGVQGGISNGENIVIRTAFKPTATIMKSQETVSVKGKKAILKAKGRHDPCVLPRAVPMVESMIALVLADHALRHEAQCR